MLVYDRICSNQAIVCYEYFTKHISFRSYPNMITYGWNIYIIGFTTTFLAYVDTKVNITKISYFCISIYYNRTIMT